MPAQYERIRDSYIAAGKSEPLAKKLAAMTYNAHRKRGTPPVTRFVEPHRPLQKKLDKGK